MKQFFAKAFFVLISLISGYITSYYLIQFTCANQSPMYTRQFGPPSDLQLCEYKATIPAAVTGLLVGLIVLYILLKTIFKYSIKSYGIFLLKLVVFIAVNWGLIFLLYNPVSDWICNLGAPTPQRISDSVVISTSWERCWGDRFFIIVFSSAGLLSTIITTISYFFLTKWKRRKKKS
jgi:hypothetical protein